MTDVFGIDELAESVELTLQVVPMDGSITADLQAIYDGMDGKTVAEIELHRAAIQFSTVAHLMDVRDLIDDKERFAAWCKAVGMDHKKINAAIRQYETRLLMKGETRTPSGRAITPIDRKGPRNADSAGNALWALRSIIQREDFDEIFPQLREGLLHRLQVTKIDPPATRAHCLRLAQLLLEAGQDIIVDSYPPKEN